MRDSPWPVVPRPFADEAFGSWFGRLALRYRIGVDELAIQADVELDFGHDCSHWLATPTPTGSSLRRLGDSLHKSSIRRADALRQGAT